MSKSKSNNKPGSPLSEIFSFFVLFFKGFISKFNADITDAPSKFVPSKIAFNKSDPEKSLFDKIVSVKSTS